MIRFQYLLLVVNALFCLLDALPVNVRGSSPSGQTVVAISSANPRVDDYIARNSGEPINNNGKVIQSVSVAGSGKSAAATGRSFASAYASSGNPFQTPFLIPTGLGHLSLNNWLRSVESYYDPSFVGNGEIVTAINDNGHIYGSINGVHFDNGIKSKV